MRLTGRMSLLKSPANITFYVRWFLIRISIWSLIIGMSGRSMGCEAMFRFIMSSGVRGLLDILKTSRYGDTFLGVGILVIFHYLEYMFCGSWQGCRILMF